MERMAQVGDRIPSVTLNDVDGKPVELAQLLENGPVVVPLVRYYGCMPCQTFLRDLDDVRPELERRGYQVIGVGGAADFQARHLMDKGISYPLLLDPEHQLYGALDIRRIKWWVVLRPYTWRKYLNGARRARQGMITDHPLQAPGFAIIGQDGAIQYLYRGETLGDYPTIPEVLTAAALRQGA